MQFGTLELPSEPTPQQIRWEVLADSPNTMREDQQDGSLPMALPQLYLSRSASYSKSNLNADKFEGK
jgi:hypothetical protein